MKETGPRWYACRTRHRSEKKVAGLLERNGVESYLPLVARKRQWADRVREVEFPLFPGYVFARFPLTQFEIVQRCPLLIEVVTMDGRPAPIPEDQMEAVQRLVWTSRALGVEPHPADFLEPGQAIEVVEGPLRGMRGWLVERRGRSRVVVKLDAIKQAVGIEMDRRALRAWKPGDAERRTELRRA